MEKRNVVEDKRTPCRKKEATFCDCPTCKTTKKFEGEKQSTIAPLSIQDAAKLSEMHK